MFIPSFFSLVILGNSLAAIVLKLPWESPQLTSSLSLEKLILVSSLFAKFKNSTSSLAGTVVSQTSPLLGISITAEFSRLVAINVIFVFWLSIFILANTGRLGLKEIKRLQIFIAYLKVSVVVFE